MILSTSLQNESGVVGRLWGLRQRSATQYQLGHVPACTQLPISWPQFLHLQIGDNSSTCFLGLLGGLNEVIQAKP